MTRYCCSRSAAASTATFALSSKSATASDGASPAAKPARSDSHRSRGVESSSTASMTPSSWPVKGSILATLDGSESVRDASRSPAEMMEPGARTCVMAPDSPVLRAMIIFMASTST